jgi:hypothetical protein
VEQVSTSPVVMALQRRVAGAQVDVDHTVAQAQAWFTEIVRDLKHGGVAGQDVAVQGGDAVPAGGGAQPLQQERAQAPAMGAVRDEDSKVGAVGSGRPLVGSDADDPVPLEHEQRRVLVVGGSNQSLYLRWHAAVPNAQEPPVETFRASALVQLGQAAWFRIGRGVRLSGRVR